MCVCVCVCIGFLNAHVFLWKPHFEKVRDEYAKGGGVSVRESSSVEVTECSFVGNSAVALVASSAGKSKDIRFLLY